MKNEFIYPLRIYFDDTDATGVVYHANYLKFMERARSEWMEQVQYGTNWRDKEDILFLIHSVEIRFLKPAHVHEQVEVVTKIKEVRGASIIFDQHLRLSDATDKILCKAEIRVVCVGRDRRPRALPDSAIFRRLGEQ